ncbi:MAG: RAMP superfamily CRISPR-associated protein, partial [Methanosarcinales archaeon]
MSWNCFELKFQAKSPIYIGYGTQLGIVNRTRYYLLGKTIWGAVTAILSRNIMERYNAKIYEKVGECVKNNLIFSYFYPMRNKKVLYPNYTDEGLKYGDLTSRDFEKKFISSYVSTAIDKLTKTAEEGSLHEFEFISPKVNKEEVCFNGYLFANLFVKKGIIQKFGNKYLKILDEGIFIEGNNQNTSLFDLVKNIQIGGERNYGFGWLEIIKLKP